MKKTWVFLIAPLILLVAAFLVYTLRPSKQYAVHLGKARLFAHKKNYNLAHEEYKTAYSHAGGFTPWVSLEVLKLEMDAALADKKPERAHEFALAFVKANPKNLDGLRILARVSVLTGDVDGFFSSVEAVLAEKPLDFQTRYLLAQNYIRQNRLDLAEAELLRLYNANRDSAKAILPLAQLILKRGDFKKSRELLRKVISDRPNESMARLYLADSYLQERDLDSAQLVFDQWINRDESLVEELRIRKARLYSMLNRLSQAESTLAPYIKRREPNPEALGTLALIKAKQGKYDSAYFIYQTIAEAAPNQQPMSQMLSSLLMMADQQPAKALEVMRHLKIGDKSPNLLYYIAACYQAMDMAGRGDSLSKELPSELQNELKDFRTNFPTNKKFLSTWAKINFYQLTGQVVWSRIEVDSLYKQSPKNPLAMVLVSEKLAATHEFKAAATILEKLQNPTLTNKISLMKMRMNAGNTDRALTMAKNIRAEFPKMKGINFIIGDMYLNKSLPQDAAIAFEEELTLDPDNLVCINNLAWHYGIQREDFSKASPFLKKLKEKNKMADPRLFDTVGWILAKQGQLDEAQLYLQRALNLQPGSSEIQYHLAYVQLKKGEPEKGKLLLNEALASGGRFDEMVEAQTLKQSLSPETQKP